MASKAKSAKEIKITSSENVFTQLGRNYAANTPRLTRLLDAYLVFVMLTGIITFVHMLVAGTFPYNAFLASFIASVGAFVLGVSLRMQSDKPERNFAEFVFCSLFLYGFAVNFLG